MSESDTMFNERDRRCTAVQRMLSTDPSYDNRTIASTLKMQIWIATNNRDRITGWSPVAIRWPVADPGCGSRTRPRPTIPKRLRLGFKRGATTLYPYLSAPPHPPSTLTRWTTSFDHTSGTSPIWPPTTPKPAWSQPSAEYSPSSHRRLWKRHTLNSGSVSRRWLRLKVATLNRRQLYYIIKLPELIFSIKVLK